ncbi:MAG: hypothetical protein A3K03_08790 [Bdellovibrionales bacterium RIFOXYD1_FULL_44_7]|nr:MAG: hypothetical protein A3K03_08790 [Bdellovibrionales bacterium RIFOXYD1_FULL_44_7]
MVEICFEIHKIRSTIRGEDNAKDCIEALAEDFEIYLNSAVKDTPAAQFIELSIHAAACPQEKMPKTRKLFSTEYCDVYGMGKLRTVVYGRESVVILDARRNGKRFIEAFSPDSLLLYDIAFSVLMSQCGELLEAQGFHRAHATALRYRNTRAVCLFDRGVGKSTLTAILRAKAQGDIKFYSDESPLIKRGAVYPFAFRMALKADSWKELKDDCKELSKNQRTLTRRIFPEKVAIGWKREELSDPGPVNFLVIGMRAENSIAERHPQLTALFALMKALFLGLGVMQMREYYLRFDPGHLWFLIKTAVSRFISVVYIMNGAKKAIFVRSESPVKDAERLLRLIS